MVSFNRLVVDDSSLGSSGSGDLVNGRVLSDGLGGSVVSSLSAEHTLLGSGAVGSGTGEGRVVDSSVLLSVGVVDGSSTLRVLSRLELESSEVFSGKEEEVDEEEDGLGQNIEDTVEDHLRVGGDLRRTIGETPSDGVKKPENAEDRSRDGESSGESATEVSDGLPCGTEENPPNVDQSNHTECEQAPLVRRWDQGTNETSDDHDNVKEDDSEDIRKGKTSTQEDLEEESRSSDSPVNVSDIPNGPSGTGRELDTVEFNRDVGTAKSRCHAEVCDRSSDENDDTELVEDSLTLGNHLGPDDHDQSGQKHDCEGSP